jgi:D-glycero-beta-D-manno-heptose 1-phosphate adenylyltransferase
MSQSSTPTKQCSLVEAVLRVSQWRLSGEQIVLTNGVFDMLHVGHLRYLQGAKALGGRLLVAVNSDASTRRLKGAGRPVIPEGERIELLAALSCVDLVICFEEDNVKSIIETLRPNVHAKGTDYTAAQIPEGAEVARYGGRVAIVGDEKAHSSTEIIQRLKGR